MLTTRGATDRQGDHPSRGVDRRHLDAIPGDGDDPALMRPDMDIVLGRISEVHAAASRSQSVKTSPGFIGAKPG